MTFCYLVAFCWFLNSKVCIFLFIEVAVDVWPFPCDILPFPTKFCDFSVHLFLTCSCIVRSGKMDTLGESWTLPYFSQMMGSTTKTALVVKSYGGLGAS